MDMKNKKGSKNELGISKGIDLKPTPLGDIDIDSTSRNPGSG